ncbi:hypothetical protein BD779DRAFT_1474303 [Infundibulicybe gibba]|nr:hypothetical protein BD779DRAFT_1474303 [Infundibulicybe gibba]
MCRAFVVPLQAHRVQHGSGLCSAPAAQDLGQYETAKESSWPRNCAPGSGMAVGFEIEADGSHVTDRTPRCQIQEGEGTRGDWGEGSKYFRADKGDVDSGNTRVELQELDGVCVRGKVLAEERTTREARVVSLGGDGDADRLLGGIVNGVIRELVEQHP